MAATPEYIVLPQESPVQIFTGRGSRELTLFLEDLEELWDQRPDLSNEARGRKSWALLSDDVRRELRCQGLSNTSSPGDIKKALCSTYGEKRTLSQLAMSFHGCRQEGFESLRTYSQRLYEAFTAFKSTQTREGLTTVETSLLRDQFVEGLQSESLKIHLRQYKLMNAACTFVGVRDVAFKLQGVEPETAGVHSVAAPTLTAPKDDLHHAMADLKKQVEQLTSQLGAFTAAAAQRPTLQRESECWDFRSNVSGNGDRQ